MATSSRARYVSVLANTLNSSGKITSNNILLPDSGVTAGSYGSASQVPVLTIDSKGRVTSASVTSVAGVTSFGYNTANGRLTINTADGGAFNADVTLAPFSTTNLTEGTNLYFTTARARASISASGSLAYNSTTGALTYTQGNTDTVAEGATNLYYTSARARSALSVTTGSAAYNSTSGQITIPSTTSHITEGSNLFYTDARAKAALSAGTGVSYSSSTGVIAIGQPVGTSDNVTFNNVNVAGNLTVSGTTTTVNSTVVSIADINIELARNAANASQANGAGLTVTGPATPATITYSSADDRWNLNKDLNVNRVYGNLTGSVTGNASTATTLQNIRSITATGDASWTVNFDGSANESATLTLANTGVTAGSYGSSTAIPVVTVDSKGRITSASTTSITVGDGAMTVTAGSGLTGGGQLGTANQTGASSVTVSHADTSSVTDQAAATNTFVSGITFDTYGHVQTVTRSSPSGFLTAESDTLATVTARGASTSTASTFSGGLVSSGSTTLSGGTTLGTRTNSSTFGGNTGGLSGSFLTEVRAASAAPSLTFHYENVATRHIQLKSDGAINFVSPSSENSGVAVVQINGNNVWHAGNLTNLNQLTNGPGYITGYTETDTLATVTARGASTSTSVTLSSTSNHYNGHFYWDAYDASGNHYPHFNDGSNGSGVDINWRLYTGTTNSHTHVWNTSTTQFVTKLESTVRVDAPIFYDRDDTGYYADLNSTSNIGAIRISRDWGSGHAGLPEQLQIRGSYPSFTQRSSTSGSVWLHHMDGSGEIQHYYSGSGLDAQDWSIKHTMYKDGTFYSAASMRSPIFYDANDTNYYTNPASTSYTYDINTRFINFRSHFDNYGPGYWYRDDTSTFVQTFNTSAGNASQFNMRHSYGNSVIEAQRGGLYLYGSLTEANNSLRAPIFYDNNDTAYYGDFASTSVINNLNVAGTMQSTNGNGAIRLYGNLHIDAYNGNDIYLNYYGARRTRAYVGTSEKFRVDTDGIVYAFDQFRTPIVYDNNDTGYYVDPNNGTRLNSLTINDGNVQLWKSITVDMSNTGVYSTSNYYPVVINVPTYGLWIEIQNNLNSNVPSWSTHGGGFTLNLRWWTNGSGWGTTEVKRRVEQYHERFTNSTICGGITQMTNGSIEVVWLRGGGQYYFRVSRDVGVTPYSSTYTNNGQTASPTSSAQNSVWNSVSGTHISYNTSVYADTRIDAPIFYDYNDTGYYFDGTGGTRQSRYLTISGGATGSYGNELVVGNTSVSYSLEDGNQRPIIQAHGQYPVLSLNHTITSNSSHGPTIQYTCNGVGNQFVHGTNGNGTHFYMGYSSASDWNPHNGISGYNGTTFFEATTDGYIGLGAPGDWGNHGGGNPGYHLHFKGYNNSSSGHAAVFQNTVSGTNNGAGFLFQNDNGNHSWGVVAELRIAGASDRPSLLFSSGQTSTTWSVGYGGYDDNFRVNQNHGHRNGSWGSTRLLVDTSGNFYSYASTRSPIYYDSDDTGWYADPASTSRMRNIDVCSIAYTANYYDAAIEVREYNMEGAGDDTWQRAPRIGFHWGGRVASSIAMSSNGWINIMNNPGTGFESFRAASIFATGEITAGYSDERLKTKVGKIENAIASVMAIETFKYTHNDIAKENGFTGDDVYVGVSAQSVERVLPEVVKHAPFDIQSLDGKIISKSGEWYKTVDYERLTPLLIEAIKEQQDKITRLEALVETLINKLGEK